MATPRFARAARRALLALVLALAAGAAFAAPPKDADIDRLLKASRAERTLEAILPQMEAMQQQQFAQVNQGRPLTPEQQQHVDTIQQKTRAFVQRTLSWQEMRPLYLQIYREKFSRDDVLAMAKFYESDAGQKLLDQTPALMQSLMGAVRLKMVPLMQELDAELKLTAEADARAQTEAQAKAQVDSARPTRRNVAAPAAAKAAAKTSTKASTKAGAKSKAAAAKAPAKTTGKSKASAAGTKSKASTAKPAAKPAAKTTTKKKT